MNHATKPPIKATAPTIPPAIAPEFELLLGDEIDLLLVAGTGGIVREAIVLLQFEHGILLVELRAFETKVPVTSMIEPIVR